MYFQQQAIKYENHYLQIFPVYLFVQPKVSGLAHVIWSWHKRSQGKSKLTRSDAFTV